MNEPIRIIFLNLEASYNTNHVFSKNKCIDIQFKKSHTYFKFRSISIIHKGILVNMTNSISYLQTISAIVKVDNQLLEQMKMEQNYLYLSLLNTIFSKNFQNVGKFVVLNLGLNSNIE